MAAGDLDAFTALVLDSLFTAAHRHALAGELTLINYEQLPALLFSDLLASLSISCTPDQLDAMQMRSKVHSKYRDDTYSGDPQPQQEGRLAQLAASLAAHYQALETLRLARCTSGCK